jgi:hypothetical protein
MITKAPEKIPPTPIPATALPIISVTLDGATAHISDPNSNTKIAPKKTVLI